MDDWGFAPQRAEEKEEGQVIVAATEQSINHCLKDKSARKRAYSLKEVISRNLVKNDFFD